MAPVLRIGSWLWRLARQPATLLGLLAGCAALALLAGFGVLSWRAANGVDVVERLSATWFLLTMLVSAARAAEEVSTRLAATGLRSARARLVADASPLMPASAWAQRVLLLLGLLSTARHAATANSDATATSLFGARPLGQRLLRAGLYLGLALAAGWAAWAVSFGGARPAVVLLLGQPAPLAQSGLTLTLTEASVVSTAAGELRLKAAQVLVYSQAAAREVVIGPGQGVAVSGRWLRLQDSLAAAAVRVEKSGGRAVAVYPIDGARPTGNMARVWFRPQQQEQLIAAPQAGVLIRLVRYGGPSISKTGLAAEVLDGATGAVLASADATETMSLDARGCIITVTPEVAARVTAQPLAGRVVGWLAGMLVSIGLSAHLGLPLRRVWVASSVNGALWLLDARAMPWDRRWLARLVALLANPDDAALP